MAADAYADMGWRYGDTIDSLRSATFRLEEAWDEIEIARRMGDTPTESEREQMYGWLYQIATLMELIDVG